MHQTLTKIMIGQMTLMICCGFYLLWWRISYRPNETVNRLSGINGVLLLITAISGVVGVILSSQGQSALPAVKTLKMQKYQIMAGGIIAYVLLFIMTTTLFHRPVTTELFLIIGWVVLELMIVNALNGANQISDTRFWLLIAVIMIAFCISMGLYILYYRMEPYKAYYWAMVPLITEGVSMGILLIVSFL